MGECVLYWLFDENCVCLWRHGYVGVSTKFEGRLKSHRKSRIFPRGFSYRILFRGSSKECRRLEWILRPGCQIGWNSHPGGGMVRLGSVHTSKAKQRMSESAKRRLPISDETREKLRTASLGKTNSGRLGQKKSDEEKSKISKANLGKKRTDETLRKLSVRMTGNKFHLGHKHSIETKECIRQKKIGVAVHSDDFKRRLSERTRRMNLSNKGKPWTAARRLAFLRKQHQRQET